jgi:hypothetical protein
MSGYTYQQLAAATRQEFSYWGVSSSPADTEAFIKSLANRRITYAHAQVTFTVTASGANKVYWAHPDHLGAAVFTDPNLGGFVGGFILRASGISHTDSLGTTRTYRLYETTNAGLGLVTATATLGP